MKRTFWFLILALVTLYGHEGYRLYCNLRPMVHLYTGRLSDIAAKVTPLVLDTKGAVPIQRPAKIRMYQEFIYLIDNQTLYRFTLSGDYVGRITNPDEIQVADYVIDSQNNRLIIFGNQEQIFYCTLEGEIRNRMQFPVESSYSRLQAVNYHDDRIWVVQEIKSDAFNRLERVVVEYTTSFEKQDTYKLEYTENCSRDEFVCMMTPSFAVAPDTGELYVYSPPVSPFYLKQDTLAIHSYRHQAFHHLTTDMPIYPIHMGKRFSISSRLTEGETEEGYLFCYDSRTNKCWELPEGMTDNLYGTGQIRRIEPLDVSGERYWYVSENSVGEVPVIFIMEMKS